MDHFTVTGVNKAGVDLVLMHSLRVHYVNHVLLMQTGVSIDTRSTSASCSLKGWNTKITTATTFV